jgi:hypothetical protein
MAGRDTRPTGRKSSSCCGTARYCVIFAPAAHRPQRSMDFFRIVGAASHNNATHRNYSHDLN